MKRIYYSGKLTQLKILLKRVRFLLKSDPFHFQSELSKLKYKIHALLNELRYFIKGKELKKIIGGVTMLVFLSYSEPSNAQSFASPQENPFGLSSTVRLAFPSFVDLDNDGDYDLLVGEADQDA